MSVNKDYHPDSVHHPDNVRRAEIESVHLEALAIHVRREVMALVDRYGFEIDVDHWGTGKTVLRHSTPTGYDYEIPLGVSE